jgi:amino acid transporter
MRAMRAMRALRVVGDGDRGHRMGFGKWFVHLVGGMVRGCLVLAILALAVSVIGTFIATGHVPSGWEVTLIAGITIVSGLLGAVAALAWRLSHIEDIVHVAEEVVDHSVHRS